MKQTQEQKIIELLHSQGFVTRNWALQNFISRLGAIICNLKKVGWEFSAGFDEGNYVYRVISYPDSEHNTPELPQNKPINDFNSNI